MKNDFVGQFKAASELYVPCYSNALDADIFKSSEVQKIGHFLSLCTYLLVKTTKSEMTEKIFKLLKSVDKVV